MSERRRRGLPPNEVERHHRILRRFTAVYCRDHHHPPKGELCHECVELLGYARRKLERCPYDPKPKCKECATHCYKAEHRQRVREIMRYSGMYFVKRGRVDWLLAYFLADGLSGQRARLLSASSRARAFLGESLVRGGLSVERMARPGALEPLSPLGRALSSVGATLLVDDG